MLLRVPGSFGDRGGDVNSAFGTVLLQLWERARAHDQGVMADVDAQARLRSLATARSASPSPGCCDARGQPVQFVITGLDVRGAGVKWRDVIIDARGREPGTPRRRPATTRRPSRSSKFSSTRTAPPTSASRSSRSARTLETLMGFRRVTTFVDRGEEYDVMLEAEDRRQAVHRPTSNRSTSARRDDRRTRAARQPRPHRVAESPTRRRATATTGCVRSRSRQPRRWTTRSARRSSSCRASWSDDLGRNAGHRLQGAEPRVRRGVGCADVHVRDLAAARLPRARGTVRELPASDRDPVDRAARGVRRTVRDVARRATRSTSTARSRS